MEAVKSVLKIILTSIMAGGVLLLFLTFTLPAIQEDRAELVEQEMDAHNQTLEMVKQDFSYVLSDENISADVKKNILLTISGEYCVLKVTLNRELKVISLETVEKIHDRDVRVEPRLAWPLRGALPCCSSSPCLLPWPLYPA